SDIASWLLVETTPGRPRGACWRDGRVPTSAATTPVAWAVAYPAHHAGGRWHGGGSAVRFLRCAHRTDARCKTRAENRNPTRSDRHDDSPHHTSGLASDHAGGTFHIDHHGRT